MNLTRANYAHHVLRLRRGELHPLSKLFEAKHENDRIRRDTFEAVARWSNGELIYADLLAQLARWDDCNRQFIEAVAAHAHLVPGPQSAD